MNNSSDFVVVGAGVFGAWTARYLRRSGASVALVDAYGPGNSRSSSGGESRILRMGYGTDQLYTQWALRSFPQWRDLLDRSGQNLLVRTGVLWLGRDSDPHLLGMRELLTLLRVPCEQLTGAEIGRRYPQLRMPDVSLGVLEPDSGVVLARRAVQALVRDLEQSGVTVVIDPVEPLVNSRATTSAKLTQVRTSSGQSLSAAAFVFACGAWLPKLFPDVLAEKIFPTRQEVFFLGPPAGNNDFSVGKMPAWLHHSHADRPYALPNIESRGFKIAFDRHGPEFDPQTGSRVVAPGAINRLRAYLGEHVPELEGAPVVETLVCQYENTWNGDFLIDRHPGFNNVWVAGGGSGHGFKHGPAVGEYLAALILGQSTPDPRFSLANKQNRQMRGIY
ncbi:MAG TPA: FAD-dependent oxidoreductase [Terriglobales bacterium]